MAISISSRSKWTKDVSICLLILGPTLVTLHLRAYNVAQIYVSFSCSYLKNILSFWKSKGTSATPILLLSNTCYLKAWSSPSYTFYY